MWNFSALDAGGGLLDRRFAPRLHFGEHRAAAQGLKVTSSTAPAISEGQVKK